MKDYRPWCKTAAVYGLTGLIPVLGPVIYLVYRRKQENFDTNEYGTMLLAIPTAIFLTIFAALLYILEKIKFQTKLQI